MIHPRIIPEYYTPRCSYNIICNASQAPILENDSVGFQRSRLSEVFISSPELNDLKHGIYHFHIFCVEVLLPYEYLRSVRLTRFPRAACLMIPCPKLSNYSVNELLYSLFAVLRPYFHQVGLPRVVPNRRMTSQAFPVHKISAKTLWEVTELPNDPLTRLILSENPDPSVDSSSKLGTAAQVGWSWLNDNVDRS